MIIAYSWIWEPKNQFILTKDTKKVAANWYSTEEVEEWCFIPVVFFFFAQCLFVANLAFIYLFSIHSLIHFNSFPLKLKSLGHTRPAF